MVGPRYLLSQPVIATRYVRRVHCSAPSSSLRRGPLISLLNLSEPGLHLKPPQDRRRQGTNSIPARRMHRMPASTVQRMHSHPWNRQVQKKTSHLRIDWSAAFPPGFWERSGSSAPRKNKPLGTHDAGPNRAAPHCEDQKSSVPPQKESCLFCRSS